MMCTIWLLLCGVMICFGASCMQTAEVKETSADTKGTPVMEPKMDDATKVSQQRGPLTDRDVRIVYLPSTTVASAHYIGDEPERHASGMLQKFIKDTDLLQRYPATRLYGFNHPNPGMREDKKYGYEFWITIPDDMEVPAPLEKKHFAGGLYAAHMILSDDLNGTGWDRLLKWARNHKQWQPLMMDSAGKFTASGENMFDLLEEHLNYSQWDENKDFHQFDLLMPIKKRNE